MEDSLVTQAGLQFSSISATGLRGKNPLAMLAGIWSLNKGYQQSRKIIRDFRPDVLFITGGYVCVPMTLAAWWAGIPVIIYLPDIEPGLAIKFLARFATKIAVTVPETQNFFAPELSVVTGYPVRKELLAASRPEAQQARLQMGLAETEPTLLVFGGSQGARSINKALTADLESYLDVCQIIHVTGYLDEEWVQSKRDDLSLDLQKKYYVSAFLHNKIVTAFLAADLVVSRAGASVLGEFPAAGLPAILVPYPYAGAHQWQNANYLAQHQAAIAMDDKDLQEKLKSTVLNLITNKDKLDTMSQASLRLARKDASFQLAQEILGVHYGRN